MKKGIAILLTIASSIWIAHMILYLFGNYNITTFDVIIAFSYTSISLFIQAMELWEK